MYIKIIYIIWLVLLLTNCSRQHINNISEGNDLPVWIEMMEQADVEISKAREEFDRYWESHTHFKGDRSKQFEQWYAINSKRLDQTGRVISAEKVNSEFQKLRIKSESPLYGNWFNYGPINVGPRNGTKRDGGRVKDIEFHPTDSFTFYVSTFKGGLFKTVDYGVSWTPLTDNLTEQVYVSEVSEKDPDIIFIGTNLGVFKTTDGGINWNPTPLTDQTKALLIKDDNENIVIAGTENGIYHSENGGLSWHFVQSADKVEDLDIHPSNPNILYASTNGTTSQFLRSEDGGLTWDVNTTFGQGCFMGVAVSPAQSDYVYVINLRDHLGDDSFEGFYFSDDSGNTFTKQSGHTPCISGYKNDGSISRGQPNYNLFVCADPQNADIVYAGGVRSWKSTDRGKTWIHFYEDITTEGDDLHLDQLNWAYSPHDFRIFAVNDGGIYYLNEDDKFQMITDGLPIAEIYECSQSQTKKSNVAGGTMHCGIKLNYSGEWITPWGGDESTCIIDPTDEKYVYHLKYEKISRSTNGGLNFTHINKENTERGFYTGTGLLHKGNPNILYAGLIEIHRSENARASSVEWKIISNFGGNTKIQKIEMNSSDNNMLYVARGNDLYRSDNINSSFPDFTKLTSNLPYSGTINDIATHPIKPNIVYILLGSQIFKSSDKGNSWMNISGSLPEVALLEMVYDNSSKEGIYVGTDIGVFYKDTTMTDWMDYSKNLPAIRVSGMDIYYGSDRDDSFITISTDGRGFWRSLLHGASGSLPSADFTSSKTSVFVTEKINFKITSPENAVGSIKWTFENGTPGISYEKEPIVSFNKPGSYKAILEVNNSSGSTQKTMTIEVKELIPPVADISASQTTVMEGNSISFNDLSTNMPTSWEWTFEGGIPATSTEQFPHVNYTAEGIFDVTLKVSNSKGSNIKTWADYITVTKNTGTGTLQAHYEFDGNLADNSPYKRDLWKVGDFSETFSENRYSETNKAYQATGNNNLYITSNYKGIGGNNERTITAWFKTDIDGPIRKTIVSWGINAEGQMFNVMIHHDGRIRVEAGACNVQSTIGNLNDNKWHHVAVTYNSADGNKLKDIKIYIDGNLDTNRQDGTGESYRSAEVSLITNNSENGIRIGASNYSNYYFTGKLDDLRIYNKSLSPGEISQIFNHTTAASEIKKNNFAKFYSGISEISIELISVETADARLYDIQGRLIKTRKVYNGINHIVVRPGIYIARVVSGKSIETEKVIALRN